MSTLVAVDVAILTPPEITARAIELSAALPADGSQGLRLDSEHLPHITLTQQFIREDELDAAFERIDGIVATAAPLRVVATGPGRSGHTLWIAIERTPELSELHEQLMGSLRGVERPDGGPHAFVGGNGRMGDVLWVASYRLKASFGHFTPHITLGHGTEPPAIEPFAFDATTIAAAHLGRFCTCQRILRSWHLER
jgi:2'-5' RNA ligase